MSRPSVRTEDEIADDAWYAAWLGHWTFFAMPNALFRDKALSLALRRQIER